MTEGERTILWKKEQKKKIREKPTVANVIRRYLPFIVAFMIILGENRAKMIFDGFFVGLFVKRESSLCLLCL
jgi:hypothetical protein